MNQSEIKAKEYADKITDHMGSEPMHMPIGMIRFALKLAFENGYREGEIDMMCNFHGIKNQNKENNNEISR